ncbi:MAG: 3-oxoacyl-ACP synthase III family protein [Flavobacteriaceae bacterium]
MKIGITGTGCYIPSIITPNKAFEESRFLDQQGSSFKHSNTVIIDKFKAITGIAERRYAKKELNTSDLGFLAAREAIKDAAIDPETLDYIIFAHNFGDIKHGSYQADTVPSLATRVKHLLKIKNTKCVAYDMLFGCPGWIEGVIQAQAFIKSGIAKRCLVIGAETLSRVVDPHDRDSMIYSDGAGAAIIEIAQDGREILAHTTATHANGEAYYLFFGDSYNKQNEQDQRYIKMYGRKIYEFAITHVPLAIKDCLEQSGVAIQDVKKLFLHQANEKMDEAIVKRFYALYGLEMPKGVMPMNIQKMGNSSVATIPTLFHMVKEGKIQNQSIQKGDVVIFASVGAGMNINAFVYRC